MAIVAPVLTCSTCDDYQLIPDELDGMLIRCPDCIHKTAVRCPQHGRSVKNGKCPECSYEAAAAEELIELGGRAQLHPFVAVIGR